jgi:hypothetical protein
MKLCSLSVLTASLSETPSAYLEPQSYILLSFRKLLFSIKFYLSINSKLQSTVSFSALIHAKIDGEK